MLHVSLSQIAGWEAPCAVPCPTHGRINSHSAFSALMPLHAFMISCVTVACLLLLWGEMPVSLSFKISNTRSEPHGLSPHFVPFSFSPTPVAGGAVSDPSPFSCCVAFELPSSDLSGFFHLIPLFLPTLVTLIAPGVSPSPFPSSKLAAFSLS